MALNFPNSPTNGQLYTDTSSGNRWTWDSANTCWKSTSTYAQTITVASTAPGSPAVGQLWWNQDYGRLLVYYNDGTSSQWVDASPSDYTSYLAYNTANAAFSKANNDLANTSGTFAGDLSVTGNVGIGTGSSSSVKVSIRNSSNNTYSAASFLSGRTIDLVSNSTTANDYSGIRFSDPIGGRESFFGVVGNSSTAGSFIFQSYDGVSAYAERMRINSSGYVTKPYQPMCWVTHNTSVTYSTNQLIQMTSSYDPLSMFSGSSNYRITVPVAGRYLIVADLLVNSSSTGSMGVILRKNGSSVRRLYSNNGYGYQSGSLSAIVNCAANDYFDLMNNDSSCNIWGGDIGNFTVILIG